ncbi:MAG: YybH family protein [Terriglobia bacterium]
MKKLYPALVILLVLAISGCAPQMDVEAEEAAIRETANEWMNAANAKDVERLVDLYADDASLFPPNAPLVTGKEAIGTAWSELIESPGFATSLQTTKVEISRAGDLAYSVGTYEDTRNDPEGNPVTDRGKWVVALKKQPDGAWKIVADIWNLDLPATPATD